MLGCLIPLGTAMETTGTARFMAEYLVEELQAFGPTAVLSGLYLVTTVLTSLMSNNATGVLMLPIAISLGEALGPRLEPFGFCVMFSASASFMTPMGYQTNAIVRGAGGYTFGDYLRIGIPLTLIMWGLATLFIPIFWPL